MSSDLADIALCAGRLLNQLSEHGGKRGRADYVSVLYCLLLSQVKQGWDWRRFTVITTRISVACLARVMYPL